MEKALAVLTESWLVLGQMAPYLLFGFFVAGLLSIVISPEWIERHLGGKGLVPIVKSALFGVPLPLCSCGVIPVTASLRRHGAGRGATTAFLLSTPQTGVDSLLATYALLGPVYAIFRPLAAFATGVLGGTLVSVFDRERPGAADDASKPADTAECHTGDKREHTIIRILRYGFITLPGDISKELLVGIAIAGVISALVTENVLAGYLGGGLFAMLVMMAFGIPIYVCSTASIPIAMGFMHLGASPGAALVFLITGPATNAAAITVVWRLIGRRSAIIYLATVAIGALAAGFLLDYVFVRFALPNPLEAGHAHGESPGWLSHLAAVVLLAVIVTALFRKRDGDHAEGLSDTADTANAEATLTLRVKGMTCSHCTNTVARALRESPGVTSASVNLSSGQATVTGSLLDPGALIETLEALNYEATVEQD